MFFFLGEYINEDGELALAYETQKTINKQLELELQDEKAKYKAYEKEYKLEIEKLREDNERQQRLLAANLTTTPQSQTEAFMQHEITRLTNENLELQDKNDTLNEQVRKLKKQIKLMTKKLKEAGLDIEENKQDEKDVMIKHERALPSLRKKDRDYMGMFSYPAGVEGDIMKELVVSEYIKNNNNSNFIISFIVHYFGTYKYTFIIINTIYLLLLLFHLFTFWLFYVYLLYYFI